MKWCVEPIKNPTSLREIYIILEQREVDRRTRTTTTNTTTSKHEQDYNHYSAQVAQLAINRLKNRYCDIYPYDHNRIRLNNPLKGNDYINASWIKEAWFQLPNQLGNQIPNFQNTPQSHTWIAAQAPLRETCYEFLCLCLVQDPYKRPQVIVQLTACQESGREKSARYIPERVGESIEFSAHYSVQVTPSQSRSNVPPTSGKYLWTTYNDPSQDVIHGQLRVTLEKSETGPIFNSDHTNDTYFSSSFYHKNTLTLELFNPSPSSQSDSHQRLISKAQVIHYECIEWPDRGIPSSVEPILELISSAKKHSAIVNHEEPSTGKDNPLSPILVHCSAGVGRTGTLIAIASFVTQLNQLVSMCPLDLKAQVLCSLLPPPPSNQAGRLPPLPSCLEHDLVAHTIDFLREQRVSMVQTESQIGFVYKAVAHLLDSLL